MTNGPTSHGVSSVPKARLGAHPLFAVGAARGRLGARTNSPLRRAVRGAAIAFALQFILSGCIPGLDWVSGSGGAASGADGKGPPSVNRSFKANFLAVQTASAATPMSNPIAPGIA